VSAATEGPPIAAEAGRLLSALEDWVRSGGLSQGWNDHVAGGLEGLAWIGGNAGTWVGSNVGGSQECRLCPLCQLLALVRTGQPELWEHLGAALGNLADAFRSAVDGMGTPPESRSAVERIDVL
jgi:hypothetical protein